MGCYIGNAFCGTFSYADDIIILAPTLTSVHHMLFSCEEFAKEYEVIFNSSKSKILVFPYSEDNNVSVPFMGSTIEQVRECSHLGNIIGDSDDRKNIECTISNFYGKLKVLLRDFAYARFDIKHTVCPCTVVYYGI